MTQQISFKDLTTPLKVFVIIGWIIIAFDLLAFLLGFIRGFMMVVN